MPEGDTIFRLAAALRPYLMDQPVLAAHARPPGPKIERVVGSQVLSVEPTGKHLAIGFSNGLALHSHLGMAGSWHRYRPGERWWKPAHQARVSLEVPGSVLVCFNAPTVELLETRALPVLPAIASLGPDVLAEPFDHAEALRRLRLPERAGMAVADALLDQHALAGVGNVYKSEVLFLQRVHPWTPLAGLSDADLAAILDNSGRLLKLNARAGTGQRVTTAGSALARGSRLWVYGRAGRPCFRCGTRVASRLQGPNARRTYWCPSCQAPRSPGTALLSAAPRSAD